MCQRIIAGACGVLAILTPLWVSAKEPLRFADDVLPILTENCFACHGPDPAQRKAKRRFDIREGLFSRSSSGVIPVVPH